MNLLFFIIFSTVAATIIVVMIIKLALKLFDGGFQQFKGAAGREVQHYRPAAAVAAVAELLVAAAELAPGHASAAGAAFAADGPPLLPPLHGGSFLQADPSSWRVRMESARLGA
mmetsp:Transcript_29303/g.49344  ORF Transcript_29303/g.49344 Transcript_29303/m.49344 type:complete len:114 (-) Transcript_29303:1071-1412(-)